MAVHVLRSDYLFPYFLFCAHCRVSGEVPGKVPLQIDYARDLNITVVKTKVDGLKSVKQVPTVTCPRCKKETRLPEKHWKAVLESLEADGKHKVD
ncbi:MAG: hypothetical protein UW41_C0016G0025 [Candidatus Collierbacteria bacterium GW2011_GWC2_44_18]|uniref:Uncharacterized protein n=2 Tax=Microgenomates group TaxID=1794810 RepID=A0A0G1LF07_9BACT|nr:MAG: hypothetical protein UW16_C0027G0011 [Microgenomates group bacterium GW2011_GWC1_44_10]KKT48888.1 MAG: hypothetical protein UW41_C0016G0025 [Candidatus Collierbacteria bacterium GW2011_GWC2_44_18]KKT67212.1 MAG: hypothetical protein UW60_C0011G0012 [Candidatus Woesebacteria bacterium GW2011_GWA2_44_33]